MTAIKTALKADGMTRTQQRQLQKLAVGVDRPSDADREFFKRFPDRKYRVRLTSQAEIEANEILEGKPWIVPEGQRWFTAVRLLAPGVRVRAYISAPEGVKTDLKETLARTIFEYAAGTGGKVAEDLRKIA
jgi:hypothetical protein